MQNSFQNAFVHYSITIRIGLSNCFAYLTLYLVKIFAIWQIYFAQVPVWQQSSQSAARDIQKARKSRLHVSTEYTRVTQALIFIAQV